MELNHNMLTVTGERTAREEKTNRHMSEIGYGRFERTFTLPDNVDAENVSADFENGMLEVTLPVAEADRSRRQIEVSGAKRPEKAA